MSIKQLAEDDRPREKFLTKGRGAVSDSELLAIIMGSGSRTQSAVDLARTILDQYQNNWHLLSEASVPELMRFKGVGEAKAVSIATALEIGKRRALQEFPKRRSINQSRDIYEMMHPLMADLAIEEFWLILLNAKNKVIHRFPISRGGIHSTVVDVRWLFKQVLEYSATAIILVHNHPSGEPQPSSADRELTQKIVQAGQLLDIRVLDHIIIAKDSYFSFSDHGSL
ncbi:RadC family protein [Riemerella columbina]|uniref:RadC family protein n=1 Tax=Riemerella columbina TaxID=103810 RepID=UPI0026701026|nr:DNA repair protein RadC [Riemerella columbina]WKS94497.1 DNA repair protein RadC [Riemerella columbina]